VALDRVQEMRVELAAQEVERIAESGTGPRHQMRLREPVARQLGRRRA
jgi:hypothetical protein